MHIWQSVYWFQSPSLLISTQLENSRGPTHVETTSLGQHKQTIHDSNLLRDCGQPIFTQNVWCNWKAHDVSVSNSPCCCSPLYSGSRKTAHRGSVQIFAGEHQDGVFWTAGLCYDLYIRRGFALFKNAYPPRPYIFNSISIYLSIFLFIYLYFYLSR